MKLKFILLFVLSIAAQLVNAQTIPISELKTDKSSYVQGDRAVLIASVRKNPTTTNDDIVVEGTLDGQRIKMTSISAYHAAYVTAALPVGSHVWEVKVYSIPSMANSSYKAEIANCDLEEIRLKRLYLDETDAAKKTDLLAAIAENASNKANWESQLLATRTLRDTKQYTLVVSALKKAQSMLDPLVVTANHVNPIYYLGQSSVFNANVVPANISSAEELEFEVYGEFDNQSVLMNKLSDTEFSYRAIPSLMTMGTHTFKAILHARSKHNSMYLREAISFVVNRKLELELLRDSSANSGLSGYYQREIEELVLISNAISDIYSNGLTLVSNVTKTFDVQAPVLSDIMVGRDSACAIKGKALSCWGSGFNGGFGDTEDRLAPTLLTILNDEISQVSSYNDSCAIKNGSLYCWGNNNSGTVGDNSTAPALTPVQISIPGTVQKVSQGESHACAVSSGYLYCWGSNAYGQFGNGTTVGSLIPKLITLSETVTDVKAMSDATCVITATQKLQCFGSNAVGQLGDGTTNDRQSPVTIFSSGVTAVTGRALTTCAIVSGSARCWGSNSIGRLGRGNTTNSSSPVNVTGFTTGVTSISVGNYHVCGVVSGAAKCWGLNPYGILGDGSTGPTVVTTPGNVSGMSADVDQISAGAYFTCLRKQGNVYCWGSGTNGQLGNGTGADSATLVQPTIPMD